MKGGTHMNEQLKQISQNKETAAPNEQQKVFYEHWKQEAARAHQSEQVANQHARDRMKGLTAPELRKIGAKQLLWGWGLSFLNAVGGGLGFGSGMLAAGGLGSLAASAGSGALGIALGISAVATPFVLGAAGVVAGAEFAGYVYEKLAMKYDKDLPKLDSTDKILGGVFSFSGLTPPMIAGARNIFEGYNQMKSIQ